MDVRDGEVTWQEIADELGLSRKGAKYVYNSAIKKLKDNPELKKYWLDLIGEEHEGIYISFSQQLKDKL